MATSNLQIKSRVLKTTRKSRIAVYRASPAKDYSALGAEYRNAFKEAIKAAPTVTGYVHDLVLDNMTSKLSDYVLGVMIEKCNASNLRSLGYTGVRAKDGSWVAFYTAILYKIKDRFGRNAVYLNQGPFPARFRGVIDSPGVKEYFLQCVDQLTLDLLRL